jgi:Flp pilus assembly protein TadD
LRIKTASADNLKMASDIDQKLQLAVKHHQAGRFAEAEILYREVLKSQPTQPDALHLLGLLALGAGRGNDALDLVRRALLVNPKAAEYYSHLGVILLSLGRVDESISALRQAVNLSPKNVAALTNLAISLSDGGMHLEAKETYLKALAIDPDLPNARLSLGFVQLVTGDFENGWENYEWRTRCVGAVAPREFSQPRWDGTPLNGKTILIHAEQGCGDAIQFVRYIPRVAASGGRIVLQCRPELARLLQGFPGVDQIVTGNELPSFDAECPLLSLPRVFGTRLNSIPAGAPYLKAGTAVADAWEKKLGDRADHPRIGLAWAGRPTHSNDRNRSMTLSQLGPLGNLRGFTFYSLQKGQAALQPSPADLKLVDFTSELTDFADTAALIACLDLVITVDTAVAHLAGAMGKSVWVLLPFAPDWRWLLKREDSLWYPTMRLFRQKKPNDWVRVVGEVVRELKK